MKDALGHGSEPRGIRVAHQTAVFRAVGPKFKTKSFQAKAFAPNAAERAQSQRADQDYAKHFNSPKFQDRLQVLTDPKITDKVFRNGKMIFGGGRKW